MSSEFLEKIRKIIVILLVLFASILNAWIAFATLPVHAAESGIPIFKYTQVVPGSWTKTTTCLLSESCDFDVFCFGDPTGSHKMYVAYINPSSTLYYNESSYLVYDDGKEVTNNPNPQFNQYPTKHYTRYSLSNGIVIYLNTIGGSSNQYTYDSSDKFYNFVNLSDPSDKTAMQAFLESYYVDKTLTPDKIFGSSIDNPDFEDTAYAFTGFTANNKMTANWTGTTERSYLKDQEVEEYVRVNYYFADKEAQDTIKQADAYPDEFATADKTLTIDVSGLKPDDENWFLRYIRITPCYRQAGLGAWGDFYHGSDVFVYFDVNGKIESIVQNSVPTDGEVIGNNISLIGFRYDTSFHAEFVDVWSNAVNCSAFDLGGSQYLSLGVKALYYNGQSKDIDFVSLDRKNLVWDKTFDSFKTFNGSGIKQLFFTPYIKTGVNNPWNKGNSIVIDFDVNGNATSSFDTGDDGTVHLSDFKLTGVVWNKPMLAYGTITWTGTTANSDMSIVPDSDTLVVCSYPVYDSSLNESYETYDTVTIGKGSIRVYIDSLIDKYTNAGKTWNGEMWLTPCYKKGGVLYMGEPVIVNCTKGTVSDIEVDESTGTANQVDKTDENKSYADAILSSGNNFFSIVKGLIASMQQLPELIATLFSFLPGWVNALIAGSIFIIFVCRILGR